MAQYRRSLRLGLLWLAALVVPASAATPSASKAPPVSLSAVWLKGQGGAGRELHVVIGESTPVPLLVGSGGRGRPVEVTEGGGTIRLLGPTAHSGVAKPGTPSLASFGEIKWPAGSPKRVLLVLAATKGATGPINGVALADDETVFPVHTVRVANFTTSPYLMRFHRTVKELKPGTSEPLPYAQIPAVDAKDAPSMPFALAAENDIFFNGRVTGWLNSRTLVLIAPKVEGAKAPAVQIISDIIAPSSAPRKL